MGYSSIASLLAAGILLFTVQANSQERKFEPAWELSNCITISDYFLTFYLPHASALLHAETMILDGVTGKEILEEMQILPGVNGALVAHIQEAEYWTNTKDTVPWNDLAKSLLGDESLFKLTKSPMTHKMLGGRCKFRQITISKKKFPLMVRAFQPDLSDSTSHTIIGLILDPDWLVKQIPSKMDSLARESSQLLFWAASPTNNQWEQSIGIISGSDTLWWAGPKDVEIKCMQALWPFQDIAVQSNIRSITQ